MIARFAAIALVLVSLSACTARYYPDHNDSTGITADSRAVQTPRETCFGGCTRDYNNCMDESSNSREALPGTGAFPSAGRGCDRDMKACQKRCSAV